MIERLPYQTWRKGGGMGFVAWLVVGLIAGWLAGQVMRGGGYGVVVDIILGLVGGGHRRLGLRPFGNLAGRGHDRLHRCCICWRCDFGWDYPFAENGLTE